MTGLDRQRGISYARAGLAGLHLLVGVSSFIRPHQTELVAGYAAFNAIFPTTTWGGIAFVIGTGLIWIPRGHPMLIVWQFASAAFFGEFCWLVSIGPTEVTWGSFVYGGLAVWSVLLSYATADDWFKHSQLPWRTKQWVITRLGHVRAAQGARRERDARERH